MAKGVYCLANDDLQAQDILNELRLAGFSNSDVSVLWPDEDDRFGFSPEKATKAPEGATTGASTGGVIGGVLGWLAGIGALAIPGLGAFVAAGPIMGALSGAALGATVGGLTGALIGLGIPEFEAKRYEAGLRGGKILIACRCNNNDEAKAVKELFKNAGACDVCATREKSDEELDKKEAKMFEKEMKEQEKSAETPPVLRPPSDVYTSTTTDDYPRPL